jgi:hypothetical protein
MRPQFTIRALLIVMLVVAAFFAGIHLERERRRRADEAAIAAAKGAKKTRKIAKRVMEPPGPGATAKEISEYGAYLQSRTYPNPTSFYFQTPDKPAARGTGASP